MTFGAFSYQCVPRAGACINGVEYDGETPFTVHGCKVLPADALPCNVKMNCLPSADADITEKLCDIADGIEALCEKLQLPDAADIAQAGCVKVGGKLGEITGIVYAVQDEDGNIRFVMKPLDGGSLVDPYAGEFSTDCEPPEFQSLDCYLNDPDSPFCGMPLFTCPPSTDVYVFDAAAGWTLLDPSEHDLSLKLYGAVNRQFRDAKEDLSPFKIDGPYTGTVGDVAADALAASAVTDYAAFPKDILLEHISRCGQMFAKEVNGAEGLNIGGTGFCVGAEDTAGVNFANDFEVADGCCVVVTFCAVCEFEPPKVPVVTRVAGENITMSSPPTVDAGDVVEFTDDTGTVVSTATVASVSGSSLVMATAQTAAVKGTVLKRQAAKEG